MKTDIQTTHHLPPTDAFISQATSQTTHQPTTHHLVLEQDVSRFPFTHNAANSLLMSWPRCAGKEDEKRLAPGLPITKPFVKAILAQEPLAWWSPVSFSMDCGSPSYECLDKRLPITYHYRSFNRRQSHNQ